MTSLPYSTSACDFSHAAVPSERPLRLGVLDLCRVPRGCSARNALFDSFELAVEAESLGYTRYWLGEHHGPESAHSAPEMLAGLVAQTTNRIRVGTAAVLLNYYSPLKVAKSFRLLQALFPGRIDLGVGAGGVSETVARELLPTNAPKDVRAGYADRVRRLAGHLAGGPLPVMPEGVGTPGLWVMGSGGVGSAKLAGELGAHFGYALFLQSSRQETTAIGAYRDHFRAGFLDRPAWNVAVAGVCSDTELRARYLLKEHPHPFLVPAVVGTPEQCREQLEEIRQQYETDEIVFLDLCADLDDRIRSYRLLSEVMGLRNRALPTERVAV